MSQKFDFFYCRTKIAVAKKYISTKKYDILIFGGITMSDSAYADFTEQVLSLSYEQTIALMGKMLESLKNKRNEENYSEMENDIARSSMNAMWEELKNDTW